MAGPLTRLEQKVIETVEGEGFEIVELDLGQGWGIRVAMDAPEGVRIDDCTKVHRQLKSLLETEGLDPGDFRIEVESPGADRKLRTPADFERFRGSKVNVKLREKRDGQKRFIGTLEASDEGGLVVEVEEIGRTEFPFAEIDFVRLHV